MLLTQGQASLAWDGVAVEREHMIGGKVEVPGVYHDHKWLDNMSLCKVYIEFLKT